jgi:thioredoxin
MSATVELSEATFKSTIEKEGIVLIDWWAPWCGPCRAFGPVFEKVAARHPDVTFAKIDTEREQALASALGIQAIPTLMVLRDGVLLYANPGVVRESALEEIVQKARDLDMEQVRAEIAREDAAAKRSA